MSLTGEFRERDINGEPFLIFSYSSLSSSSGGETTIDSDGDNLPLQPLFICPSRRKAEIFIPEADDSCFEAMRVSTSPHFDQENQYLLDSNNHWYCKSPVLPLYWCNNKDSTSDVSCDACGTYAIGTGYYLCVTCKRYFHKECVECPLEIRHPSHPFRSLQLFSCSEYHEEYICCQEFRFMKMLYRCPIYKFQMHPSCALKPIPIFINHPKRHPHPLTFFPKQNYLPCNICGLIHDFFPTYVCARCVFVVHEDCIYFPHVIRISRHHHRISFTSSLPSGKWSCGVCRRKVDNNYGAYACNKCNSYVVHSRCATRRDLWDGEELEGVAEEPEIVVEPFEKISDGIILHFSHDHHLKLQITRIYDPYKFCQACVLPVYEGIYYSCVDDQCDFILHEKCANAPLKKHHGLHARSLTLEVLSGPVNHMDSFVCNACFRPSCGFVYEYSDDPLSFKLDVRCALVEEPFEYQGHDHLLYLALKPEEEKVAICRICQEVPKEYEVGVRKLNCIECDYIICFRCATLPYTARYKHDKHLLTFCQGSEESDHSDWCDVCERKIAISTKGGFYSCDEYCCTTLHIDCLLGKNMYAKPGHTISDNEVEHDVLRNNTISRPFCHHCKQRCQDKVVFIAENVTFCSLHCSFQYYTQMSSW